MKLDWRHAILYITIMGMEGCWLYASIVLLNTQVAQGLLSAAGILLLYPLSFILNRLLIHLHWHRAFIFFISWLAWLAGMLLIVKVQLFSSLTFLDPYWLLAIPRAIATVFYGFRPELMVLASTAVIWWLGRRLARHRADFPTVVSEFQFGVAMLLIILFSASVLEIENAGSVPAALTFFSFALLGISIAHARESSSWLSGLHQGQWTGLLLVSIGIILITGTVIGVVMNPELMKLVLAGLKWAWGIFLKVVTFILSLLPEPEPGELPEMPIATSGPESTEDFKIWSMPEWVRSGGRLALNLVWGGIILFALWRISSDIFGWLHRKLGNMSGAEFEPLPNTLGSDFLRLLGHILAKLFGIRLPFLSGGKTKAALPEVASVRKIYRQLLQWASAGGYARQLSQTPHEFLDALSGLLPESRVDLELITQQYTRTRYGTSLPTGDELYQLGQSWHRVRQNRLKNRRQD